MPEVNKLLMVSMLHADKPPNNRRLLCGRVPLRLRKAIVFYRNMPAGTALAEPKSGYGLIAGKERGKPVTERERIPWDPEPDISW